MRFGVLRGIRRKTRDSCRARRLLPKGVRPPYFPPFAWTTSIDSFPMTRNTGRIDGEESPDTSARPPAVFSKFRRVNLSLIDISHPPCDGRVSRPLLSGRAPRDY